MIRFVWILTVLTAIACVSCAVSETSTRPVQTEPAEEATTQPTSAPAGDVMKILAELEKAGREYKTLRAEVDYHVEMVLAGDSERRSGYVAYRRRSEMAPDKFRVHFETLRQGEGENIIARVDYAFDGQWLSVARHRTRQLTRYQVAAEGQQVQPMRLGKGPFPMPFGQTVADVLKYFQVTTRKVAETDPKNTDYLKLTTLPERRRDVSFRQMEMWIDRSSHLPTKIISIDKSKDVTTVIFKNIRTNVELDDDEFLLPRRRGWKLTVKPLEELSDRQGR